MFKGVKKDYKERDKGKILSMEKEKWIQISNPNQEAICNCYVKGKISFRGWGVNEYINHLPG